MTIRDEDRRFGAARALLGLGVAATGIPRWALAGPGSARAVAAERRFFRRLLRAAGVTLTVRGAPAPEAGTLYASNHISWVDIPLLGSVVGAGFVAKGEIEDWPLIGTLSRRIGCVFVARGRRGQTGDQAAEVAARLATGGVILFPEGTTADGATLLPFRSSLFAAARAARRVQPVAILYVAADGGPLPPDRLAEIAWGEEGLLATAARFTRRRRHATLCFLPPIEGPLLADRKALAAEVRERITAARAAILGG